MSEVGMDAEAVRGIAAKLEASASEIGGLISAVEGIVGRLQGLWLGHDAQDFTGWWHNQHKPALTSVQHNVNGLAQSARNNATEQDTASGGNSHPSWTVPGLIHGGPVPKHTPLPQLPHESPSPPAGIGVQAAASSAAGTAAVSGFVSTYNGLGVDVDHQFGNQCVDLFEKYNTEVVGAPSIGTPVTGGARDLFEVFPNPASQFYDRIPYTPGQEPQPGDVAVWGATGDNRWGHVAIVTSADSHGITCIEQNGFHPSGVAYVTNGQGGNPTPHPYGGNLLGYLRPKKFE